MEVKGAEIPWEFKGFPTSLPAWRRVRNRSLKNCFRFLTPVGLTGFLICPSPELCHALATVTTSPSGELKCESWLLTAV